MNKEIQTRLPKIQKLGLTVPDYVTSGEKFIDYINELTDSKVPYKDETNPYISNWSHPNGFSTTGAPMVAVIFNIFFTSVLEFFR